MGNSKELGGGLLQKEERGNIEFLKAIINGISGNIFLLDPQNLNVDFLRLSGEHFLGWTVQDLSEEGALERYLNQHKNRFWESVESLSDSETREEVFQFSNKDEELEWIKTKMCFVNGGTEQSTRKILILAEALSPDSENLERLEDLLTYNSAVTEAIPDPIYLYNTLKQKLVFTSLKGGFLGIPLKAWENDLLKILQQHIHPEDFAQLDNYYKKISRLEKGELVRRRIRLRNSEGQYRWVEQRELPFKKLSSGKVIEVLGILRDVTEEVNSTDQLRQSQELYQSIAANLPESMVSVVSSNLDLELCEGGLSNQLQFNFAEGQLSNVGQLAKKQDYWAKLKTYLVRAFDGESFQLDLESDGLFLATTIVPLMKGRETEKVLAISQDLTRMHNVNRELARSEALYRFIPKHSPNLHVLIFDQNQRHLLAEGSRGELFNKSIQEFEGRTLDEIIECPELLDRLSTMYQSTLEGKEVEMEIPFLDDFYNVKCVLLNSSNEDRQGMAIFHNITKIKRTQGELSKIVDEITEKNIDLEQSELLIRRHQMELEEKVELLAQTNQEMERYIQSNLELERFAYIASHDLREPLRSINGFAHLLLKHYEPKLDDRGKEYIRHLCQGTENLDLVLNDLLLYSRVNTDANVFEEINTSEILEMVKENLRAMIIETQCQLEVADLPPAIIGSRGKLTQLIQNLISNAIKFSDNLKKPRIQFKGRERNNFWQFSVVDNGIGIPKAYHNQIFILFKKLHDKTVYKGSGLGLAICKRVVEQHKGRIWVEENPEGGSIFHFTLSKNPG